MGSRQTARCPKRLVVGHLRRSLNDDFLPTSAGPRPVTAGDHGRIRGDRAARWLRLLLVGGWWAWMSGPWLWAQSRDDSLSMLRVGFSSAMFSELNENDARAAVKSWGQTIAREYGVPVEPQPTLLRDRNELREALSRPTVDAFGLTILEYEEIREQAAVDPVFITFLGGTTTERYLLLSQREGSVKEPSDLAGCRWILHQGPPRLCLARMWLESLMRERAPSEAADIMKSALRETKVARVVLPVFFGQADACVVTRNGFDSICELNPQVAQRLRVVAQSEDLVPIVFGIRKDFRPSFRQDLVRGLRELHKTPAGQQVLTLFQSERILDVEASRLDPTLAFITRQRPGRVAGHSGTSGASGAGANLGSEGSVP